MHAYDDALSTNLGWVDDPPFLDVVVSLLFSHAVD